MELPKRKPNRLKNYDYSINGAYFLTLCIKNGQNILWNTVSTCIVHPHNNEHLSDSGLVIDNAINSIKQHYTNVLIDKYVIMPNHVHMIVFLQNNESGSAMRSPTISNLINQMKGYVTKQIGYSAWQKSFHDHIIRDEYDYKNIWQYIDTNPERWKDDCFNEINKKI